MNTSNNTLPSTQETQAVTTYHSWGFFSGMAGSSTAGSTQAPYRNSITEQKQNIDTPFSTTLDDTTTSVVPPTAPIPLDKRDFATITSPDSDILIMRDDTTTSVVPPTLPAPSDTGVSNTAATTSTAVYDDLSATAAPTSTDYLSWFWWGLGAVAGGVVAHDIVIRILLLLTVPGLIPIPPPFMVKMLVHLVVRGGASGLGGTVVEKIHAYLSHYFSSAPASSTDTSPASPIPLSHEEHQAFLKFLNKQVDSGDTASADSIIFSPEELQAFLNFLNKQADSADTASASSIPLSPEKLQAFLNFLNKQVDSADTYSADLAARSVAELQACLDNLREQPHATQITSGTNNTSVTPTTSSIGSRSSLWATSDVPSLEINVIVHTAYKATKIQELTLTPGQQLTLLQKSTTDWWWCSSGNSIGFAPSRCLSLEETHETFPEASSLRSHSA